MLIAPLATYPATIFCSVFYAIFNDGKFNIKFTLFISTVGAIAIALPACTILFLSVYTLFKEKAIINNPWLYIGSAIIATIIVGNKELGENGLGVIYITSSVLCGLIFWYVAIRIPSRTREQ